MGTKVFFSALSWTTLLHHGNVSAATSNGFSSHLRSQKQQNNGHYFQIIQRYICLNVYMFLWQDKDVARLQDFQELEVVLEKTEGLSLFSGGQGGLTDRPCYNMKASRLTY